ncbi:MAG: hypothetical protein HY687_04560 [Chloroflexi bacterium]|nr:hypothetical protein [Chloroflexota bacterium]
MPAQRGRFATAINCIDGRVQGPVLEWMKEHLGVDYIDKVTEPGPDKALTQGTAGVVEAIRQKVQVSISAHGSRAIAIVGHYDCAANPVSREEHLRQIRECIGVIASWGFPARILGLWVNEQWQVEHVSDTELAVLPNGNHF